MRILWRMRRERLWRRSRTGECSTMSQQSVCVSVVGGTAVVRAWRNIGLVKRRVEGAERQEMGVVKDAQQALAARLQEEGMDRGGGKESHAKFLLEQTGNRAARRGPVSRLVGVGEERIEGELGALKCHRHAVAGERRDHRARIAECDAIGCRCRHRAIKTDSGDRAERSGVERGIGETLREGGEAGGGEIAEEEIRAFGAKFAPAEEAAEVDLSAFDAGEADVGLVTEVEFEIVDERQVARVDF